MGCWSHGSRRCSYWRYASCWAWWCYWCWGVGGAAGVGARGGTGAGAAASSGCPAGAAEGTGAGGAAGAGAPVGAGVDATGAAGGAAGAGGAARVGADAGGAGAVPAGSGGAARPRPYFVPLLEQVLGLPPSSGPTPSLECPPLVQSESQLQLASPVPAPSPYAGPTGSLAERPSSCGPGHASDGTASFHCAAACPFDDTLRTTLSALGFAPSTADPSLFLRTDTLLPPFYILVYVDNLVFATGDTAGLAHVKSELQKRHTCTDLGELHSYLGLQITRDRARRTITLTQSHMVQQVLQRFDFMYSSPQATPLSTRHSLSALPSDESVEPSGPYPELVGCLITSGMGLVLGGRIPVVLTGHADASWVDDLATQRSSQGYTFSLVSGSVSWRSTRSSSVLSSSCEAEIYAGAMAAHELRWLTYLLSDLGEPPRSPPFL
ncbi:unnamed protein product, partial [Closterium sp. NIES-53]